jgi:hypothetical protein
LESDVLTLDDLNFGPVLEIHGNHLLTFQTKRRAACERPGTMGRGPASATRRGASGRRS